MSRAIRQRSRATLPSSNGDLRSNRLRRWICFRKPRKSKCSRSCGGEIERGTSVVIPKVLVADAISERGLDELSRAGHLEVSVQTKLPPDKLVAIISEFAALIVRSETKVTAEVLNAAT